MNTSSFINIVPIVQTLLHVQKQDGSLPLLYFIIGNSDPAMSTAVDDRLRNAMSRRQELLHRLRVN